LKQLNTYFYLAALLVPFGHLYEHGLAFRVLTLPIYQTTFSSLHIHQAVNESGGHFCNPSDSLVFGLSGTKEISVYLETRGNPFLRC
jgi:hypothetical protein